MSINKIQDPLDLRPAGGFGYIPTPTKHPVRIIARASNVPGGSGRAWLEIRMPPASNVMAPVNLTINGNTYEFRLNPVPGQLPWRTSAIDPQPSTPVVNGVLQALYALYYALSGTASITSDYELFMDASAWPLIRMTAKEAGPKYTTTQAAPPLSFTFVSNPGTSDQLTQVIDRMRCRLRVFVDRNYITRSTLFFAGALFTPNLQDWVEVATLERPFIPNQDVEFDVQDVLRPYVRPTSPVFTLFVSQYEKYKLDIEAARLWRYEADFSFVDTTGISQARRGFNAGSTSNQGPLPGLMWATWLQLNPYLTDQEVAEAYRAYWGMLLESPGVPGTYQVRFLTSQPVSKRIDQRSIEYLTFYKNLQAGYLHMQIVKTYTDGQTETEFVPEFSKQTNYGGILRTEVSPRAIPGLIDAVAPLTFQPLDRYSVQFFWSAGSSSAGAVAVTEVQTYEVSRDDGCDDTFYQVLFLNRLGGFDTLWLGSRVQELIDRKEITYQTYRRQQPDKLNSDYEVLVERATVSGNASAGYVDKLTGEWLQTHLTACDEAYMLAYESRLGGFNYRRIGVDKLAIQVNQYREKGLEATADFEFTYLIDLK